MGYLTLRIRTALYTEVNWRSHVAWVEGLKLKKTKQTKKPSDRKFYLTFQGQGRNMGMKPIHGPRCHSDTPILRER